MWSFSINGEKYLADSFSVKTQSFGLQWRPHRLTMIVGTMSTDEVSLFHVSKKLKMNNEKTEFFSAAQMSDLNQCALIL